MSRRSVFLLLLLLPTLLAGQEIRLSNRFVIDLAVDGDDLVWAATENGLNCFDGISTRTFLKGQLSSSVVNGILADRDEPLVWIALQKGGLACYDKRTDTFLAYRKGDGADELSSDDITHLEQGPDGDIWASTFTAGIERLDRQEGHFTRYNEDAFPGYRNASLHTFKLRGDQLVLGYWSKGVSILSLTDHSRIDLFHEDGRPDSLPSDEVRALLVDAQNRIWVGTTRGLALYSDAGRSFTVFRTRPGDPSSLPEEEIFDLVEDGQGHLFVATASGEVFSLDIRNPGGIPADVAFTPALRPQSKEQPPIRCLSFDHFGNLWIGTYGDGLHFRSGHEAGAGQLRLPREVEYDEVPALCFTSGQQLLAGTRAGLAKFGPDSSAALLQKGVPVQSLLEDADRRLWTGTPDGRLYVSEADGVRSRVLPGVELVSVRALLSDGPYLWAGTDRGLLHIDRKSRRADRRYTRLDGLPDNMVRTLLKDRAGRLWVGMLGHGLCVYDEQMEMIAQYDASGGLPSDTVNHLLQDEEGRIWVATSSGLVRFDAGPGEISAVYAAGEELADDNVRALAEDAGGNLWMSTNDGISCLTASGKVLSFDRKDGLPDGNYCNAAVAVLPDGRILFGTTDAIAWVHPAVLMAPKAVPPVSILTPEQALSADWRGNFLRIRFSVPDYTYARSADYAYRIADLDSDWHPCERELEFNHLPYGRHELQVRAVMHAQDWDGSYSSVVLTIHPPFWLTWWAKSIYVLLALGIVAVAILYLYRRGTRKNRERLQQELLLQERRNNEERLVFFTNVTHELRTPLTLILGPLEDLSEDNSLPAPVRTRIGRVKQSARQLLGLVNQLLEFRKTETQNRRLAVRYDDLSAFVTETGARFQDLSIDKSVTLVLSVTPDIRLWFDAEALAVILNNLLSNARKFTPSGRIVLSLQREGERVALSVSDTGCGIPADDLNHIFERYYQVAGPQAPFGTGVGLALVKNLCDLHHVDLSVVSEPGKGSEFKLLFDPQEDYPEASHEGPVPEEVLPTEPELPEEDGGIRVLVVEDNDGIRDYIRESLSPEYRVLQAKDGREGLKSAVREIPDVVISDIMMPVMDGIAMCKAIRQDVRTSHIPVILLTAKGSDESRVEGYDVGADSYLVKPFNKTLLLSRIRNLMDNRRRVMREVSESGTAEALSPVDNEFLAKFTAYVEERLGDERIDIVSLAGQFAMSQSTLYRKVKAVTGLSPNELIRNIRLGKAAEMLKKTSLSVSEISWQVGFGSPVYFRTCFKERFGVTPTEYRER